MGYEVHITRKESWSDEGGPEIAASEWASLLKDGSLEPITGDATAAWWTAHPGGQEHAPVLLFHGGNIDAKPHDESSAKYLLSLAERLNAKLQGDDDELWTAETIAETYSEPLLAPATTGPSLGLLVPVLVAGLALAWYLAQRALR